MVNSRQLDTSQAPVMCAVCGRSLLRGEHANVFISGGARRDVCELCTTRATHDGWIRDGADAAPAPRVRSAERARSLMGRLRSRLETAGSNPLEPASDADEPSERAQPLEPREIHAVPTNAELKVSRALELFNRSEHTKTVSGVARSLGAPAVTVTAHATDGALVEILAAWELCWYRYEVDLADEQHAVRLLAQGYELAELGGDGPPAANAVADVRGALASARVELGGGR